MVGFGQRRILGPAGKEQPSPSSSPGVRRRATEACRAAAGGHGLTTGFVTSISYIFFIIFY